MSARHRTRLASVIFAAIFATLATIRPALGKEGPPRIFENEPVKPRTLMMSYRSDFGHFGPYLVTFFQAIEQRWAAAAAARRIDPNLSAHLSVSVTLNDQGGVARISTGQGSATGDAAASCIQAVADAAPFGLWSDEMVKALGHEQTVSLTFYYSAPEAHTQ